MQFVKFHSFESKGFPQKVMETDFVLQLFYKNLEYI